MKILVTEEIADKLISANLAVKAPLEIYDDITYVMEEYMHLDKYNLTSAEKTTIMEQVAEKIDYSDYNEQIEELVDEEIKECLLMKGE